MNICDSSHDEIVFEGRQCPLCEAVAEIDALKEKLSSHECERVD